MHRYRDRVFTFASHTLRQRQDAEDVTQEVLVRLWRHRARIEDDKVLAWLLRVTRNACFDLLRRRKVRRERAAAEDEHLILEAPCGRPSPLDAAEASDFERRLEAALGRLSPAFRELLVLREIEGLTYDEISRVTGRPLSSVKVYLHRGRKQLRRLLAADAPTRGTTTADGAGDGAASADGAAAAERPAAPRLRRRTSRDIPTAREAALA